MNEEMRRKEECIIGTEYNMGRVAMSNASKSLSADYPHPL
jgi:hypothetical protein